MDAQSEGDILIDRERQWIRSLKNHPHLFSQLHRRDISLVNVFAEDSDLPLRANVPIPLVHPVETPEQSCLSTAARTDERSDLSMRYVDRNAEQCLEIPIPQLHIPTGDGGRR